MDRLVTESGVMSSTLHYQSEPKQNKTKEGGAQTKPNHHLKTKNRKEKGKKKKDKRNM